MTDQVTQLTAQIVSAYVSHNACASHDIPNLIDTVRSSLMQEPRAPEPERQEPAVPVKQSVKPDFIVCLEDGKKFKMLKRHLRTTYGMSPEDYRRKWNLPPDYPMTAPRYAEVRSKLAKDSGLGTR